MLNLRPEKLENELVTIVPLEISDFERLFQVASDPQIWEQHPTKERYKAEVFKLFFDGAIKENSSFLVFDKATQKLIGSSRYYDYNMEKSHVAIGYTFLSKKYWGGQYNKAMKKLLIDYAFQFVDIILFHVGTLNYRSQSALLKIGAVKINEVDFNYYGKKVPHFEYAIQKKIGLNNIVTIKK